jgi:hypothetical protein
MSRRVEPTQPLSLPWAIVIVLSSVVATLCVLIYRLQVHDMNTWVGVIAATVGLKLLYSYGTWRFFRHGRCRAYFWFSRGKRGLYCRKCCDHHWVNPWIGVKLDCGNIKQQPPDVGSIDVKTVP